MATGSLRFRTPHIEELPSTHVRQQPGFAWVAVSGPVSDPSKNWGTANRKRARNAGQPQTESQREVISAKQQEKIDRKIRELNSDTLGKEVAIPKRDGGAGGSAAKAGKTSNTKKILSSGKTLAHYLDDEEAEIARTGRREIEFDPSAPAGGSATASTSTQRASKTPIARRKPPIAAPPPAPLAQLQREGSTNPAGSPAPSVLSSNAAAQGPHASGGDAVMSGTAGKSEVDPDPSITIPPPVTPAELQALLNTTPLTYAQARSGPPPANAPPPRKFCEICGYWGKVRCMKCGLFTCSVPCKDVHDEGRCLKFYA